MKQAKLFGTDEEPKVLTSLELAKAEAIAMQVEEFIKPLCDELKLVGSLRRKKPTVGDCDFIIIASDANWGRISQALKKSKIICAGPSVTKLNIPYENSLFQVDFYRATTQTFGIQELIRTGSADHNIWLASYALSKGFKLKYSAGLIKDKIAVAGKTEESIFTTLGLPCPLPSEREIVDNKPDWMPPEKLEHSIKPTD